MSTRLKITDSIVINADEIVALKSVGTTAEIYTTGTDFNSGDPQNYLRVIGGSASDGAAIKAAIEKALTSAPSGRVIKVPASPNYTITGFTLATDF